MTILQVIKSRERDLGGFVVRRILPFDGGKMVGPFIFLDHLGPADFSPGQGIDVRPHPHIGLATVTYLYAGSMQHRDSLANDVEIEPGDVNWMTAGHGIVHSERTSAKVRAAGFRVHGIQSWVALPDGQEEVEPSFVHHPASTLPRLLIDGVDLTLIAGRAFGRTSPVATLWPTLYVDARMPVGTSLEIAPEHTERAIYVAEGSVAVAAQPLLEGQLALLAAGATVAVSAQTTARILLLGGERFPTPRHIWWNFVASSQQKIENAKGRWQTQGFPQVPGETEFIPLPTA